MNNFYYPFGSLQEVYVLLFLSHKFDLDVEFESFTSVFNASLNTSYSSEILSLGQYIDKNIILFS
jgi:hypothetical protein